MKDHINKIATSLKDGMKPVKMPLRRHRDDEYYDEITIATKHTLVLFETVPRYKTSGLSGDEWRVSVHLTIKEHGNPIYETSYGRMKWATQFLPHIVWTECKHLLTERDATIQVHRKTHLIWKKKFETFADAAIGLPWHLCQASESDSTWKHISDDVEKTLCQQVGCSAKPVNTYHLKKLQEGNGRNTFLPPDYDFVGQYVWYCGRHSERGDCGFEDADANLELVSGDGKAVPHADDESPSVLGGVIDLSGADEGE